MASQKTGQKGGKIMHPVLGIHLANSINVERRRIAESRRRLGVAARKKAR